MMQELAGYWDEKHDWRTAEVQLNALPQFVTEIDGLNFISCTSPPSTQTRCR
jgi:hypothetical protein